MKIDFSYLSKKGLKNPVNQDSITVPLSQHNTQKKGWLFIVCDGVGGYPGGDIASKMCSEMTLKDYYEAEKIDSIPQWFENEIKKINKIIHDKGSENKQLTNMSTTMVSLLLKDDQAYIHNVGDSRIYIFTENKLKQITEDHSVVWDHYQQGIITKDEIINSNIKHLLTEAIGLKSELKINSYTIPLPKEYTFLLCSDGLTDVTIDSKIEDIIRTTSDLQRCVEHLYQLALGNSSRDDVTLICAKNI